MTFPTVQPVLFYAKDMPRDRRWEYYVWRSFRDVRDYYQREIGQTFAVSGKIVISGLTEAELRADPHWSDWPAGWNLCMQIGAQQGKYRLCDPTKIYYLVTKMNDTSGGMIGAENFGCDFVLPGRACISGHMGRLLGGVYDPGWLEWFADERREACGGVAHEIGHALVLLPHPTTWDDDTPMLAWWNWPNCHFTVGEKAKLLGG